MGNRKTEPGLRQGHMSTGTRAERLNAVIDAIGRGQTEGELADTTTAMTASKTVDSMPNPAASPDRLLGQHQYRCRTC